MFNILINDYIKHQNFNLENAILEQMYSIGIILIWPKHSNFKDTIKKELIENNYTICFEKQFNVNELFIMNLLREIHYNKTWWDNHIQPETQKRINSDNQLLTLLIVNIDEIHNKFKSFKRFIREKYNIDKSYFHFSDHDCFKHLGQNCDCKNNAKDFIIESCKHLNLLLNNNSLHFLKHAQFKNYQFNQYLNKY